MSLKTYCTKRSLMLMLFRSGVDFSGFGGFWDGPSHSENVFYGQTNQYSSYFSDETDAVMLSTKD